MGDIIAKEGDITQTDAEAIVNPASSTGFMGGGVAYAIRKAGGTAIEQEAVAKAPIAVGDAVLTSGGRLLARHVIHAPTMVKATERISAVNARLATRAALALAKNSGIRTIAFPGMGTGVGGLRPADSARVMIEEIRKRSKDFDRISLIDIDEAFIRSCLRLLG